MKLVIIQMLTSDKKGIFKNYRTFSYLSEITVDTIIQKKSTFKISRNVQANENYI